MGYLFTPPSVTTRTRAMDPVFKRKFPYQVGLTILRVGESFQVAQEPSASVVEAADEAWLGGRSYRIDASTAQALLAAGYGEWVRSTPLYPSPSLFPSERLYPEA